jgi:UDP-GlcNAc:undecaprenyl-phosphate/decaprenyl-phosphate GlcNAc-1-phosphate transferase
MLPFFLSLLIAALIAPLVIWWYKKRGWIEHPENTQHVKVTHTQPVPRGGGLVIFSAVLISSALLLHIDKYLIGILLGGLLLTVIGLLDDIYDLHPLTRLVAGFVAASIVVAVGIGIAYITNPFGDGVIHLNEPQLALHLFGKLRTIWVLADLFALLFIVWTMNTVNWSKGVDGQLPGFVSIAALMIGLLSYQFIDDPTQFNTAHLSFIVAGAYIGLLIWNWYPQKMMPGYGGGSLAGYFLSVLAILSGAKVATTLMVLAIPTADAVFTIARRTIAGKSPFWGDRGHLHHKLLDELGWGRRRIAVFYWMSSLVLGGLSLYLSTWGKIITLVIVFGLVFSFLIWAKMKRVNQ